jgi:hypothetical protein
LPDWGNDVSQYEHEKSHEELGYHPYRQHNEIAPVIAIRQLAEKQSPKKAAETERLLRFTRNDSFFRGLISWCDMYKCYPANYMEF